MSDIVERLRGQEPLHLGDRLATAEVIDRLRTELAEARKPDCRFCCFRFPLKDTCALGDETDNNGCVNGSRYKPFGPAVLAPLRLYEKEGK